MTHYVGLVAAKDKEELERILAPYDEQLPSAPYFEYMHEGKDWDEFEAMCKHYKTTDLNELLEHMDDWNGCPGEIRDGRLGYYQSYNPNSQWDWYEVGGRWGDIVPDNYCLVEDVSKHFTEYLPSVFVDRTGWYSNKKWGWFGSSQDIEAKEDIVKQKLEEHKGERVFVVDFHI